VLDRFKKQAASWSRRVLFVNVFFARFQFQQQTTHPLFFLKALGGRAGGRAGGNGWLKYVVLRRGRRLRRPAAAAFRLPPPFYLSRARATCSRFFLAGNLLDAVRRWRSCADAVRRKNERRVCFLVGCSLFQRKRQNKKIKI
jgi:hypothetical protein